MSNNRRSSFRSLLASVIGGGWGNATPQSDSVQVRVIRGTDFRSIQAGDFSAVPSRHENKHKVARRTLAPGDIILEISGGSRTSGQSTGRSMYVSNRVLKALGGSVIPASFCRRLRFDSSIIYDYFAYWCLQAMYLSGRASLYEHQSTGISNFQFNHFLDTETVIVPPLDEQSAISDVLGSLDRKIELNLRMNETLESIANAYFDDWFVGYGPVRAKSEHRKTYLPLDIWDLFPYALDERGVPIDWETSEIGKEVRVVGGATPSTKNASYWERGNNFWATPRDLSHLRSPILLNTARKITDKGVSKISSGVLPTGTVLMSSRAPVGYLAIAEVPTAVNQGFIGMVCEKRLPNVFVLLWCNHHLDYIKAISGGSTFGEISKRVFRPIPVIVPSEDVLAAFERVVRPLYERIVLNLKENNLLCETRDLLLPKLISGEIRIPDAEKVVDSVT